MTNSATSEASGGSRRDCSSPAICSTFSRRPSAASRTPAALPPSGAHRRTHRVAGLICLGRVVSRTGVSIALMAAPITPFEMTAESSGATDLDRRHDATLRDGERRTMPLAIVGAVAAEDIRHLEFWALHRPAAQKCCGVAGATQRNGIAAAGPMGWWWNRPYGGDPQVTGGGRQAAVTEQQLNGPEIGAGLQQVSGKGVPQRLLILLMNCTQLRFAIGVIRSMA